MVRHKKKASKAAKAAIAKSSAASKIRSKRNARPSKTLKEFHLFAMLPAELRLMVIDQALLEDEKKRPAKLVIFDHNTCRISPLVEQAHRLSPMLSVDVEFRHAALKIYVMLQISDLGQAQPGQYDSFLPEEDESDGVKYSLDCAKQIDLEAQDNVASEFNGPGRVYVRPATDIFLNDLCPRQINAIPDFPTRESMDAKLVENSNHIWRAPMCFITERLPLEACAKISDMRAMVWDPRQECPTCGDYHGFHCETCFLTGRGKFLLDAPGYDAAKYPSVDEYGIYIMGGQLTAEDLMFDLTVFEGATAVVTGDWEHRLIFPARVVKEALEADEGDEDD